MRIRIKEILVLSILCVAVQFHSGRAFAQDSLYKSILPSHPRIIINEYNKAGLKEKVNWLLKDLFNRFIRAEHSRETDTAGIARYIYSQGYAYQISGYTKWADSAIRMMEQMEELYNAYGTSPDSKAHCLEGLAIGFDWCYDRIVELGKKDKFINLIKKFAAEAQEDFRTNIFTDFHNYASNFEVAILFAGLALYGEAPEATAYLDWALGTVKTGHPLNRTTYKALDSINYVDGACNWESPTYQRISLFAYLKYIDGLDTATGGRFKVWEHTFKNLENAGYYILYAAQPDGLFCNLGDNAYWEVDYKDINNLACLQGKFKNPYFTTFLDKYFQWVSGKFSPTIPPDQGHQYQIFYLIWYDPDIKSKPLDELPLTKKFGDEIIMRNGWGEDQTMLTFRAGIHWGGHSHLDHGSFTIYKYAPLAIDSGYYDLWNPGTHIWDYWKRSIAHNTIIIFDPKESWPNYAGKRLNDGGQRMAFRKYKPPYTDGYGYFASGSSNEPLSIAYLNGHIDEFKMGEVEAYNSNDEFVYIRADLTNAYNNSYSGKGDNQNTKANLVKREFIYLKPDYVIVLDRVNTPDKALKKSWLLHFGQYRTPDKSAPYIQTAEGWVRPKAGISSYDSDLVRIDNGKGRLFCKTILPQRHILEVVGGEGYEFWVNGKNIPIAASSIRDKEEPGAWRIEVQPKNPNKEDIFLHILYPCDSSVESMPEVNRIEVEEGIGLQVIDRVVIFSKNKEGLYYQVNGMNTLKHLVCNLRPNMSYAAVIKNLTEKKISRYLASSTSGGVLEFVTAFSGRQGVSIKLNQR